MPENVETTLREVRSLKASAKSARDDEEWEEAAADLMDAIALLRRIRDPAPDVREQVDSELADTYGQLGGVERRWGLDGAGDERRTHLERSRVAYDRGFALEQNLDVSEASTYNRINRLIGRVMLDATVLNEVGIDAVDVPEELRQAEVILRGHIEGPRRQDPWAWCDIGTVRLLLGIEVRSVVQTLERLRPPRFVYESWLSTLRPLSEVESKVRPALLELIRQVERAARVAH